MAKENTVILYGRVVRKAVKTDDEEEYVSAKFYLHTIRRTSSSSDYILEGNNKWDMPCVYSRNKKVIERMAEIEEGDTMWVKGTLCTQDTKRKFVCTECGNIQQEDMAVVVYIDPIHVKRGETGLDDKAAYKLIRENFEISNMVFIDGTLCREPGESAYYIDQETGNEKFDFQIASNRIRRIVEDGPDKKVDYPWVKCYGSKAQEYFKALHLGSSVFIDGAIQTRDITHHAICNNCGKLMEKPGIATEIVPYHIEYLENCELPYGAIDYSDFTEKNESDDE